MTKISRSVVKQEMKIHRFDQLIAGMRERPCSLQEFRRRARSSFDRRGKQAEPLAKRVAFGCFQSGEFARQRFDFDQCSRAMFVDFADDWRARERFSNFLPARDKLRRGPFDERCKMHGKGRFPRNKRVEIAPRRAHLVEKRSDPEIELRETLGRILFLFERMRDIFDFAGVGRQFVEESGPFTQVIWRAHHPSIRATHTPISLFNCLTAPNCVRCFDRVEPFRLLAQQRKRIRQAMQQTSRQIVFVPAVQSHACLTAIKWAARLPLSTVEMYWGVSGLSVDVSYQLKRCP